MIIATKKETFRILKENNLIAKKGYGQNFLINYDTIKKITSGLNIKGETLVIEIGPGLGALTQELLNISNKVIAIEIDKNMVEVLKQNLDMNKLEIINEDFLKVDLNKLIDDNKEYREVIIVSNLPYYITSDILEKIISTGNEKITKIVAMMQKEVGKKFIKKEDKIESFLKVLIDNYCDAKVITHVSKNDFEPRPNVDSIVLEFNLVKDLYNLDMSYFDILKDCLKNRRKSIINTLPYDKEYVLEKFVKMDVKPTVRIEELTILEFKNILEELSK
ncbi:MAG: ribosomal RNA small subunit methyltransferase A [Bacilli bacterium]|nr:ribosomal RNA small subunit methyltransferase A [Bacilli bacterium]